MNQPMGRLEGIQYREATFYTGDGRVGSIDVLRIHFRAPDGDYYEFDLQNGNWSLGNAALQFMALWGYQPSELDGTYHDAHDDQILVPIAPLDQSTDPDWGLAETAMSGGREALEEAEWFDPEIGQDGDSGPSNGPGGASGPDPGTGNRGAVDDPEQGGVSAEMAGEESDQGITVNIS